MLYKGDVPCTETCPCCGHQTLTERAGYDICEECWWEDDGQGDDDADEVAGGTNGNLSLTAARENYKRIGVSCERAIAIKKSFYATHGKVAMVNVPVSE